MRLAAGLSVLGCLLVWLAGCNGGPERRRADSRGLDLACHVSYFTGLSSAPRRTGAEQLEKAPGDFAVSLELRALGQFPRTALGSVAERARLALDLNRPESPNWTACVATRTRVGVGAEAREFLESLGTDAARESVLRAEAVLLPGVSTSFRITRDTAPEAVLGGDAEGGTGLEVIVWRRVRADPDSEADPGGGDDEEVMEVGIVLPTAKDGGGDGRADAPTSTAGGPAPEQSDEAPVWMRGRRGEFAIIELPAAGEPRELVAVVPELFPWLEAKAFLVVLGVRPAPTEPEAARRHQAALEQCRLELATSSADGNVAPLAPKGVIHWVALNDLFWKADTPETKRVALVFAAQMTRSRLAGETALIGDDSLIDSIAIRVRDRLAEIDELEAEPRLDALGWLLVRITLDECTKSALQGALRMEIAGLVARLGGEAGRHMLLLRDLLEEAESIEDLERLLVEENLSFLESARLASRVRAYDWLAAHGLAPEGYDPLAVGAERGDVPGRASSPSEASADSGEDES